MMYQGAAAEFDRKTEKFQTWSLPPEDNKDYTQINQTAPTHSKVDGKVWVQDAGTYSLRRLDLATGKFEVWQPFPAPSPNIYDVMSDAQNMPIYSFRRRSDWKDSCEDRQNHALQDADPQFSSPPGFDGLAGPLVVRRISR
jgi:hypothetical protein